MISCGFLPRRTRPCLFIESGAEVRILGYFKDEQAMREFLAWKPMVTPPSDPYGPQHRVEN